MLRRRDLYRHVPSVSMTGLAVSRCFVAFGSIFLLQFTIAHQDQNFHRGSEGSRHANFVRHPHKILNVSAIATSKEKGRSSCAFTCLLNTACYSYNVATSPDAKSKYECQLLATDRYKDSSSYRSSEHFDHYSIKSPCESSPCQNGGTCLAVYKTGQYQCDCTSKYTGNHCQHPSFFINCAAIKKSNPGSQDGVYKLNDTSSPGNVIPAHCDMTSFGGGWTMCYTTNTYADPKDETTYDNNLPYGTNGYRTNCNNIEFSEIIFIDEETKQKEYFSRKSGQKIKPIDSYNNNNAAPQGLWDSHGLADASYSYQVMICDNSFYSGFHVSGYTNNCFKHCHVWCGDVVSPYFRTASTSSSYSGVAFNKNGHSPNHVPNKLVSVGLR